MNASSKKKADPGRLREPGLRETLRELLFGVRRPMDCIQVEVSSRCPGRCGYCPHTTRQETWRSRDMDMETFTPRDTAKLARAEEILAETLADARRLGLGFHYDLPRHERPDAGCRENIARSLFVSADGSVSPCVYLNVPAEEDSTGRRVFGNVREQDPLAIWESDAFRRFREDQAGREPDVPCRRCPKRLTG